MEKTLIRENLMTIPNYSPYCGREGNCHYPRTKFNGGQFVCPFCGFKTSFPKDFIKRYKKRWNK